MQIKPCASTLFCSFLLLSGFNTGVAAQEAKPVTSTVVDTQSTKSVSSTKVGSQESQPLDPIVVAEQDAKPVDPYEKFNRIIFQLNEAVDILAFKPAATLYNAIIPKPLGKGVLNFFRNLELIPTIINDVLQASFYQAANDTWRLGVNSTIGIGGLFDVATPIGLAYNYEDVGLTFAKWGYKNSNYLVLPIVGASTVRDGIGWPLYYGITVYPYIPSTDIRSTLLATDFISRRARILHYQDVVERASLDKYAFLRNAYLQGRAHKIEQNAQAGHFYSEKVMAPEDAG